MRNTRGLLLCLAVALGGLAVPAHGQMVTNSPNLPPPAGTYISPALAHQLYDAGFLTMEVFNINHRDFSLSTPPPPIVGGTVIDSFNSGLSGLLSINNGPPNAFFAAAAVQVLVQKVAGPPGLTGVFQTEMLQLDITGLPAGAMIRESPTLASSGQTTIQDIGNSRFMITSFFDIFTELSLDGGQSWIPSSGSGRVNLAAAGAPEPSSLALLGIAFLGMTGIVSRCKRR